MPGKRAGRHPVPLPPRWTLHVALASMRPFPGEFRRGMVYLHAPGPRPRGGATDRQGLPLWFVTRSAAPLQGLRAAWERVPPSRRHLPGWARQVKAEEVNVEVSDLGTVLQARYLVPPGVWLHHIFEARKRGEATKREEGVRSVGPDGAGESSLVVAGTAFHLVLEPPGASSL